MYKQIKKLACIHAVAIAILLAGCDGNVPFEAQEFSYRHDEENDRLLIFQHYINLGGDPELDNGFKARIDGLAAGTLTYTFSSEPDAWLFGGSLPYEPEDVENYLEELRSQRPLGYEGWRQRIEEKYVDSPQPPADIPDAELERFRRDAEFERFRRDAEIERAVHDEERQQYIKKQQIAFYEQLLGSVQIGKASFYVTDEGELGAYQTVVVNDLSRLVRLGNRLIGRWVSWPDNSLISDDDRSLVRRFGRRNRWIEVDGNQLKISVPVSISLEREIEGQAWMFLLLSWAMEPDEADDAGLAFFSYDDPIMKLIIGTRKAESVTLRSGEIDGMGLCTNLDALGRIAYVGRQYGLVSDPTVEGRLSAAVESNDEEDLGSELDQIRGEFLQTGVLPKELAFSEDQRLVQTATVLAGLAELHTSAREEERDLARRNLHSEFAGAAAEAALALDDRLPMAHLALAKSRYYSQWDGPGAEAAFQSIGALQPENLNARHWVAWMLAVRGELDASISSYRTLLEGDTLYQKPGRAHLYQELAQVLTYAGQHDEAVAAAAQMVEAAAPFDPERQPWDDYERLAQGHRDFANNRYAEAMKAWQCGGKPGLIMRLTTCAVAAHRVGDDKDAWASFNRLIVIGDRAATDIALVLIQWGQTDAAFWWLERAYAEYDLDLWLLQAHPWFESVRKDPRYKELVDRLWGTDGE